jgi:ABC-type dipeptide/oligopeptide/nickel transport systems, permease components
VSAASAAKAPTGTWQLRARGFRDFGRKLVRRQDGVVGLVILIFFTLIAVAPYWFVGPLETAITASGTGFEPPSLAHLLGTDELGRDILNLTIHGARVSMVIGLLATVITVLVGAVVGIVSGFVGGLTDSSLMRITDFFLVLPTFVLAIILAPIILDIIGVGTEVAGLRATLVVIVVVIGITSWASTARVIRSQTLSVKERMFVDRARVIGSGNVHIMRKHVLPNVMNLIVANTVLVFAGAIFTETTLSFIGLGDPFLPSWGELLYSAEAAGAPGLGAWWYIAPPATCVVLVILGFTLLGNALDDMLNPKSGVRR